MAILKKGSLSLWAARLTRYNTPCGELPVSGHVCEVASGALGRCMPLTFELDHINPVGAGRRRWAWPRVGRLTHGHDRGLERLC